MQDAEQEAKPHIIITIEPDCSQMPKQGKVGHFALSDSSEAEEDAVLPCMVIGHRSREW